MVNLAQEHPLGNCIRRDEIQCPVHYSGCGREAACYGMCRDSPHVTPLFANTRPAKLRRSGLENVNKPMTRLEGPPPCIAVGGIEIALQSRRRIRDFMRPDYVFKSHVRHCTTPRPFIGIITSNPSYRQDSFASLSARGRSLALPWGRNAHRRLIVVKGKSSRSHRLRKTPDWYLRIEIEGPAPRSYSANILMPKA